jgi:hypothetical protein
MPESLKKISAAVLEDFKKALASQPTVDLIAKTKTATDGQSSGSFRVIISTSDEDRQGDAIDQSKWNLKNFENNPVVLWAHDYYSLPIGVATKIGVENGKLVAEGKFASAELNPFAGQVAALYEAGFIKTTSVGYMQHEDGELELLEFSFVPVPANPYALSMRQMKEMKLNMPELVMKGLQFQAKAESAGDPCTLTDGSTGVLAEDPKNPGQLICVPVEKSATEDALTKAIAAEHSRHAEGVAKAIEKYGEKTVEDFKSALAAENDEHLAKCMKAIDDNYQLQDQKSQKKSLDEFKKAFSAEHDEHVKCFSKAIENFKSIDEFEKAAGAELQRHQKAQMDLCAEEMGRGEEDGKSAKNDEPELEASIKSQIDAMYGTADATPIRKSTLIDLVTKSGRAISAANKEKIKAIIKAVEDHHTAHGTESNNVIAALKDLSGPDEGNEGEDKKAAAQPVVVAPKPKVEVRGTAPASESFEAIMAARAVLRTVDTVVGDALKDLNTKFREQFPTRR